MNRIILSGFLMMATLLTGCNEDDAVRAPNFVVEAFITANEPVNNIKIKGTSPINSINVTDAPIPTAQVTITGDDGVFSLDYDELTGKYAFPGEGLNIVIGQQYNLNVIVGEREAMASTIVPQFPEGVRLPDSVLFIPQLTLNFNLRQQITDLFFNERIVLQWDSIPGQKYFVVIEAREEVIDAILPEVVPEEARELLSSFRFISEPSKSTSFEIIGVALDTYGLHVAKVFTVNEEYVDLFENLEQDSRDLNEPPSNVMNAQGIFTAFASDSVFFEVRRP